MLTTVDLLGPHTRALKFVMSAQATESVFSWTPGFAGMTRSGWEGR